MKRAPWLVPLLGLAGCGQEAIPPAEPLHAVIGPDGGSLVVGIGEIALTVPAGALAAPTTISLSPGASSPQAGMLVAGPAFRFAPTTLAFALPAQLVLPFDAGLVSSIVPGAEILVGHRDGFGQVHTRQPSFVDTASVTVDVDGLGDYWVTAPDVVGAAELWPLRNNDTYTFDRGLVLTVARSAAEPNFGGIGLARVTIQDHDSLSGLYFDYRNSQLGLLGRFIGTSDQLTLAGTTLLIASRDAIGVQRPANVACNGYQPLGSTTVAYTGLTAVLTELAGRDRTATAVGWFHSVHVVMAIETNDARPGHGQQLYEFWLAPAVGPVAVRLPDRDAVAVLQSATVNGRAVVGR